MSLNFYFEKMCWKNKLTWQRACMVPNKLVHSAELPLEHERAYARLFGKLEYVYIHKNGKNGHFWRVFENLKFAFKQCNQASQF